VASDRQGDAQVTRHVAFLRGVNLGKRTVRSADLVAAAAAMGLGAPRTLIASGNLLFDAAPAPGLGKHLETGLEKAFGFPIGVVLRTHEQLQAMIASAPFGDLVETEAHKLYVMLLGAPLDPAPSLEGVAGSYSVPRIDPENIFLIGYRQPNGRYSEGLDGLEELLPKGTLVTTRNWNTILRAAT
jgi:uncharacterized protein (DUF1697 family)